MKCIVFGLGNFGAALSQQLTLRGNEVLGVDSNLAKINLYKDTITDVVALDATNAQALHTLPVSDVDIVFVVFGKDYSNSLLVVALLKEMKVKRLVVRSVSSVHKTILHSMGITEIIDPELAYADLFATKVELGTAINSLVVDDNYLVVEWTVTPPFVGRSLVDVNFAREFDLKLVTLKRYLSRGDRDVVIDPLPADLVLRERDALLLFGPRKSFKKLANMA